MRSGDAPRPGAAASQHELAADELCARHYLVPGGLFASEEPTLVTTILGSCVSVCLFDPARRIGGANHFLLPHWVQGPHESNRYGVVAVATLIKKLVAFGSRGPELRAKIFGGARLLGSTSPASDVGSKNAKLAQKLLAEAEVPVVAHDLGGDRSRKLVFRTSDGASWVRRL
jgi:chemotaxis protein CheD